MAYQGIDYRDLYRRGSTALTLRRLLVLLNALPYDSPLREAVRAEHEESLKPSVDRIRERQRYYDERAKEAAT